MAQYSTNNRQAGSQQNISSSFKTIVSLSAATASLRRAWIYEWLVGTDSAPVDFPVVWDWSRQSTLGTGTNATPNPLDTADAAAGTVSTLNNTVEPTIGSSLMTIALNARNSQRWFARDEKSMLVVPAVNLAGIACRAMSAGYTGTAVATEMFAE